MSDYIICADCEGHEEGWSVKADKAGNITDIECSKCGGTDYRRRP